MALTKCEECGAEISTKADACPKCGAKVIRTSSFTKGVAWFIGIVALMAIINGWRASSAREEEAAEAAKRQASMTPEQRAAEAKRAKDAAAAKAIEDSKTASAYACRDLVTKRLKDPDSAKWERPWYTDAKISKDGSTYDVQVEVRAKNSFGAYDKSTFHCTLRRSGDKWTASRIAELR